MSDPAARMVMTLHYTATCLQNSLKANKPRATSLPPLHTSMMFDEMMLLLGLLGPKRYCRCHCINHPVIFDAIVCRITFANLDICKALCTWICYWLCKRHMSWQTRQAISIGIQLPTYICSFACPLAAAHASVRFIVKWSCLQSQQVIRVAGCPT